MEGKIGSPHSHLLFMPEGEDDPKMMIAQALRSAIPRVGETVAMSTTPPSGGESESYGVYEVTRIIHSIEVGAEEQICRYTEQKEADPEITAPKVPFSDYVWVWVKKIADHM